MFWSIMLSTAALIFIILLVGTLIAGQLSSNKHSK